MKSKEEFIAGIYQKAEEARREEAQTGYAAFCNNKRRFSVALAAAGVIVVCGLLSFRSRIIQPEREPDSHGIELAQHEPQALSEDLTGGQESEQAGAVGDADSEISSGPRGRAVSFEEASIQARLLRTEAAENGTLFYYEALAVDKTMPVQAEEEPGQDGLAALPEEGTEFSLFLTEEEAAWFYPTGIVPGSIQLLLVCRGEGELVLSSVEEKEETEE